MGSITFDEKNIHVGLVGLKDDVANKFYLQCTVKLHDCITIVPSKFIKVASISVY